MVNPRNPMESKSKDHGASGTASTKRGPPPTPGAVPHMDKRRAQAVTTPVPANTGKKRRVQREVAVPLTPGYIRSGGRDIGTRKVTK